MNNYYIGLVSEVKVGYVKVTLPTFDDIVTDWLQVVKPRAAGADENWLYKVGEQVVCLLDHGHVTGVCLGALSNKVDNPDPLANVDKWRKKFDDGSYVEYDSSSHAYKLEVVGAGAKVTIVNGGSEVTVDTLLRLKSSSESLFSVLNDLLTQIGLITVNAAGVPTTVPINAAAFLALQTRLAALLQA